MILFSKIQNQIKNLNIQTAAFSKWLAQRSMLISWRTFSEQQLGQKPHSVTDTSWFISLDSADGSSCASKSSNVHAALPINSKTDTGIAKSILIGDQMQLKSWIKNMISLILLKI